MFEIWRIMNWLTGRDYVHLENGVSQIIRPVRYTQGGRAYVVYFASNLVWIDDPGSWRITALTSRRRHA